MHPVSNLNYGIHGIAVSYYNGTSVVNGYIVKQLGTSRFLVTDGTHPKTVTLAQSSGDVSGIGGGAPTIFTIPINPPTGSGTGATFTPQYAFDTTTTVVSGGTGFSTNDVLNIDGGVRPTGTLTVGTPAINDTVTVGAVTATWIANGGTPSGNQVALGTTPAGSATALFTFLTTTGPATCWYAVSGTVITVTSKTPGTGNTTALARTGTGVTVSGAAITGGVAAVAGTPATVQVTQTGGVVTGFGTVTQAGAFPTLPTNPVTGYFNGNGRGPVRLTMRYKLGSVAVSGGTGYATNEALTFSGLSAASTPHAHVVASSGVPGSVVVDAPGSGITTAASALGTLGPVEHVRALYDSVCQTVEGHRYVWTSASSVNGSAVIGTYS